MRQLLNMQESRQTISFTPAKFHLLCIDLSTEKTVWKLCAVCPLIAILQLSPFNAPFANCIGLDMFTVMNTAQNCSWPFLQGTCMSSEFKEDVISSKSPSVNAGKGQVLLCVHCTNARLGH